MYKVIDVAKLFSVSKVTIYKKISSNKNELKGHIIKKKNITYLDDIAVELIKNSLQVQQEKASGRLLDDELNQVYEDIKIFQDQNDKLRAEKIALLNEQIIDLESGVRHLQSQIASKEFHLKKKDEIIVRFEHMLKVNKNHIKKLEENLSEYETRL